VRLGAAAAALVAIAMTSTTASAQSKKECADAYVTGQVDRQEGKLLEARKKLAVCAAESCPEALRRDCVPWLSQVDKDLPKVTVKLQGAPELTAAARVTIDDAPYEAGKPLDPGPHVVRVTGDKIQPAERRVQLAAGDGDKDVAIDLSPVAEKPRPLPIAPIALGGVGVVGLAVFIGFGVAGNAKKADLDAQGCKPNCSEYAVSSIKKHYVAADVSLGIGLASLVAGGVLFGLQLASPKQAAAISSRLGLAPGAGSFTWHF
jgi:hypothetical protein